MSISAVIIGSDVYDNGTVGLALGPYGDDPAGQSCLIVMNPPKNLDAFRTAILGQQIWGNSSTIMVGDTKWADREGYTKIRLVEKTMDNSPGVGAS